MASNNIEIEIRIPLSKSDFLKLKEKLKKIARFEKTVKQADEYFTPAHRNFVKPKYPYEWLSIRNRGSKTILNYKHFYPENAEITTHCNEFETEVSKPEQMQKIFSSLSMRKLVTVEKVREVYNYENKFEVALDSVKDLGYFAEFEALRDFGSIPSTRRAVEEFAGKLGVYISESDKRGYPHMLMKKKGLIR